MNNNDTKQNSLLESCFNCIAQQLPYLVAIARNLPWTVDASDKQECACKEDGYHVTTGLLDPNNGGVYNVAREVSRILFRHTQRSREIVEQFPALERSELDVISDVLINEHLKDATGWCLQGQSQDANDLNRKISKHSSLEDVCKTIAREKRKQEKQKIKQDAEQSASDEQQSDDSAQQDSDKDSDDSQQQPTSADKSEDSQKDDSEQQDSQGKSDASEDCEAEQSDTSDASDDKDEASDDQDQDASARSGSGSAQSSGDDESDEQSDESKEAEQAEEDDCPLSNEQLDAMLNTAVAKANQSDIEQDAKSAKLEKNLSQFKEKADFREQLRGELRGVGSRSLRSYSVPSRKSTANVLYPSRMQSMPATVLFAVDASGSMQQSAVNASLKVIREFMDEHPNVTVFLALFRSNLDECKPFNRTNEYWNYSPSPHGGTEFKCVLEAQSIARADLVVILSDLEGDVDIITQSEIERVVWLAYYKRSGGMFERYSEQVVHGKIIDMTK